MIKEALDEFSKSPAMNRAFLFDRMRTIGASEIGLCARRMYWVKTDGQEDPNHKNRWGARVRGTVMENEFWLKAMKKKYGRNFIIHGSMQQTLTHGNLSATPDGLLINQPRDVLAGPPFRIPDIGPSGCIAVECKSIDPRVNLTQARQENTLQTQVQMGLLRSHTVFKPDYAIISYMDASFWDEVMEYAIKFDADIYQRMHDRANKIKAARRPDELRPEGWIAGGSECEYCPFVKQCGVVRRSLPVEEAMADAQFMAEMTDMGREHEDLGVQIKALERQQNTLKEDIKNRLREKNVRRIPDVVTWSNVKGRTSYDMPALKEKAAALGIDVEEYSKTGDPTDRLQVLTGATPTR
jgi:hypothetical protein